jgi:hypothetical protein
MVCIIEVELRLYSSPSVPQTQLPVVTSKMVRKMREDSEEYGDSDEIELWQLGPGAAVEVGGRVRRKGTTVLDAGVGGGGEITGVVEVEF